MHRLSLAFLALLLFAWCTGSAPGFADEAPGGKPAPGAKPGAGGAPADVDQADDKVPFVEEVNRAIERGVLWLKAKPKLFTVKEAQAAHWGLVTGGEFYEANADGKAYVHPAGPTALALYALLKCGVDPKDPVITEGFHWLKVKHQPTEEWDGHSMDPGFEWTHTMACSSYELSAMILALTAKYDRYKRTKNSAAGARAGKLKITDPEDLQWLTEMVHALVDRRGVGLSTATPEEKRGWRYNQPEIRVTSGRNSVTRPANPPPHGYGQDLSSTQFAALALYSAHRFGVKVDPEVWWGIVTLTLEHQETTGPERKRHVPGYTGAGGPPVDRARGFVYIPGSTHKNEGVATGSMTACGLGTLLIAKDVLCDNEKGREAWVQRGFDKTVETAVNDGLAWLDLRWSPFENPRGGSYAVYYLYSVERALDILGKNLIGKHLWYTEGARELLNRAQHAKVEERRKKGPPREVDGMFWDANQSLEPQDVLDTCFALLFLKRATRDLVPPPVVTGQGGVPAENR